MTRSTWSFIAILLAELNAQLCFEHVPVDDIHVAVADLVQPSETSAILSISWDRAGTKLRRSYASPSMPPLSPAGASWACWRRLTTRTSTSTSASTSVIGFAALGSVAGLALAYRRAAEADRPPKGLHKTLQALSTP